MLGKRGQARNLRVKTYITQKNRCQEKSWMTFVKKVNKGRCESICIFQLDLGITFCPTTSWTMRRIAGFVKVSILLIDQLQYKLLSHILLFGLVNSNGAKQGFWTLLRRISGCMPPGTGVNLWEAFWNATVGDGSFRKGGNEVRDWWGEWLQHAQPKILFLQAEGSLDYP